MCSSATVSRNMRAGGFQEAVHDHIERLLEEWVDARICGLVDDHATMACMHAQTSKGVTVLGRDI